jgi:hypothetical protein
VSSDEPSVPTCGNDPVSLYISILTLLQRLASWFRLYTKIKVPKEQLVGKMRAVGLDADILEYDDF